MKVEITEQTYENYRPIMFYFRFSGVFPITVQRESSKLFLRFSPIYLIFWWLFGGFFIFMSYWGAILDSKSKSASVKLEADTDKLMFLMQTTEYAAVFFVGAFINPCQFRKLFNYISCINKVDSVIKTTYEKSEKYKLLFIPLLFIIYNAIYTYLYLDGCFQFFGATLGTIEVLKRYTSQNVVTYFAWVAEYMNSVLLNSLEKRIQRLNELLAVEYHNLTGTNYGSQKERVCRFVRRESKLSRQQITFVRLHCNKTTALAELSNVYLKIMDSANMLNDFISLSFLITTAAVFWALIFVLHLIMLNIGNERGEEGRTFEAMQMMIQLCAQICRAFMIINPAYACLVEIEKTKNILCKLLSCNVTPQYRRQLDSFALALELRQLQFSACGFLEIDRLLFASLIDTITTILMVLYQYRSSFAMFEDD